MFFIRPGAARAVKTVRLVGTQQRGGRLKGIHLGAHGDGRGLQRAPPACRTVIGVIPGTARLLLVISLLLLLCSGCL